MKTNLLLPLSAFAIALSPSGPETIELAPAKGLSLKKSFTTTFTNKTPNSGYI